MLSSGAVACRSCVRLSGEDEPVERVAVITLRPTCTARTQRKKVVWTEDTVDNEHMNKKKSKCCCIYTKPSKFGESDSDSSDDECEHCFGHVEKRKEKQAQKQGGCTTTDGATTTVTEQTPATEPTATITLQPTEPTTPPDKETGN